MRHAEKKGRSCVSRIEQVTVLPAFFGHPLSIVLSDHTKFLVIIESVSFNLKRQSHLLVNIAAFPIGIFKRILGEFQFHFDHF